MIRQDGYNYIFDESACATCKARCCTGESGYIYVTKTEAQNIAGFLNLDMTDFVKTYLFKKGYRYSLKEIKFGESYECVFYNRKLNICSIYEQRPKQCRTFPFWDYYKQRIDELKLECPGVIEI